MRGKLREIRGVLPLRVLLLDDPFLDLEAWSKFAVRVDKPVEFEIEFSSSAVIEGS